MGNVYIIEIILFLLKAKSFEKKLKTGCFNEFGVF